MEQYINYHNPHLSGPLIVAPAIGYDTVAEDYDQWDWSSFWNANESPYVRACLKLIPQGTILDAGCGTGRYRSYIEATGHGYIGIDVSAAMLEVNSRLAAGKPSPQPATLFQSDLRDCPVPSGSMEGILSARTLTHVDDLHAAFHEFKRVLRNGGLCVITDVHAGHPYEHTTIPGKQGRVAIATYKWTPQEIFNAIQATGEFEVVNYHEFTSGQLLHRTSGAHFDKLYTHLDTRVFYRLALRKRITNEATLRPYLHRRHNDRVHCVSGYPASCEPAASY